jgi:ribosomal protein S18 acetylase RimI-like enzyme
MLNLKLTTMKTEKKYKAYIASTKESKAFDSATGKTKESAIASVKRRNSPDWEDCYIWCIYVHPDGQEEKIY